MFFEIEITQVVVVVQVILSLLGVFFLSELGDHFRKSTFFIRHEFFIGSLFLNGAIGQHDDIVGMRQEREAMSDEYSGAIRKKTRFPDYLFGL